VCQQLQNIQVGENKMEEEDEYCYICGVGISDIRSEEPGKPYLDFFMPYKQSDIQRMEMEHLVNNCWTDEDPEPRPEMPVSNELLHGFQAINIRTRFEGNTMTCLFRSKFPWTREEMEIHIKYTSIKKLKEARIRM